MNRANDQRLLGEILKGVSRSFYLSIRVLPTGMRRPVAVAYLLARAADTIADTRALPPCQRLERLLAFRAQIAGPTSESAVTELAAEIQRSAGGISPSESALLGNLAGVFGLLSSLPDEEGQQVRRVVVTLTQGMELDLTAFPAEDSGSLVSLESPEQLDRYTFLVAGCVGEFWTSVAMTHEPRVSEWDREVINGLGVRFGKALQLTNVLRDLPRDLRIGRCYLPNQDLHRLSIQPEELLNPGNAASARPALALWVRTALEHFAAAETYLRALPRRCIRLRLAALWPILIGLATLEILVNNDNWLDPRYPSRVRRCWVYQMMIRSLFAVHSDSLVRNWIGNLRDRVERALGGD